MTKKEWNSSPSWIIVIVCFCVLSRSPPRPSPGSLHYSDEDVSTKYNDLIPAESSSLTEKPSEISDSQVRYQPLFFLNLSYMVSMHKVFNICLHNVCICCYVCTCMCAHCHLPEFLRNSVLHCWLCLCQFMYCPHGVIHLNASGLQRP